MMLPSSARTPSLRCRLSGDPAIGSDISGGRLAPGAREELRAREPPGRAAPQGGNFSRPSMRGPVFPVPVLRLVTGTEFETRHLCENALAIALAARLDPDLGCDHRNDADDLRLRCKPVWIEAIGRPGKVVVHAVEAHAEQMLDLLPALHRFQPGGLCAPVTDGRRGMVTTLPSGSTAPVFRSLRIGELAMTRVCGGRPVQRQARLRARL
jgi:hypothetical protein